VCYKLLERLALQCISPTVEGLLSPDQAGFRKGRSTCDQVAALTTFIENGFQQNLKSGTWEWGTLAYHRCFVYACIFVHSQLLEFLVLHFLCSLVNFCDGQLVFLLLIRYFAVNVEIFSVAISV